MVRPKGEEAHQLEKLFEFHLNEIVSDGKVVAPSSAVWSSLRSKLKNFEKCIDKSEKVIYTSALKWYKKISEVKINDDSLDNDVVKNVSLETSYEQSDKSFDANSPKKNVKKITIQISAKVWKTIEPKEILHKRKCEGSHVTGVRKYVQLQPGLWTNVFASEISKHDDVPCIWVFKRNKCYLSGEVFLIFEAKCNTCNAILVGTLKKKPDDDEIVKIQIQIHGIAVEHHMKEAKKVKLTSQAAKKIYVQGEKATVIRRNLLKNNTKMFTEPK